MFWWWWWVVGLYNFFILFSIIFHKPSRFFFRHMNGALSYQIIGNSKSSSPPRLGTAISIPISVGGKLFHPQTGLPHGCVVLEFLSGEEGRDIRLSNGTVDTTITVMTTAINTSPTTITTTTTTTNYYYHDHHQLPLPPPPRSPPPPSTPPSTCSFAKYAACCLLLDNNRPRFWRSMRASRWALLSAMVWCVWLCGCVCGCVCVGVRVMCRGVCAFVPVCMCCTNQHTDIW